jgi:hypothetical protein
MIKIFLNNNSKKALTSQQAPKSTTPLVPVIVSYPHRKGSPVKVTYVKSTCNPDYRYADFSNWANRMSMELRFMVSSDEAKRIYNPFERRDGQ